MSMEKRIKDFVEKLHALEDADSQEAKEEFDSILLSFAEEDYVRASYHYFDLYCEERQLAEAMFADLEKFCGEPYESVEEVIRAAEREMEYTDGLFTVGIQYNSCSVLIVLVVLEQRE